MGEKDIKYTYLKRLVSSKNSLPINPKPKLLSNNNVKNLTNTYY